MTLHAKGLSAVYGPALESESGVGALTLAGFLREVCTTNAGREAFVFHTADGEVIRKSYDELWKEAMRVASILASHGVGKNTRVGLLATNRPEWIVTMFGITLCGGICVALSSFSTVSELEQQLRLSDVSILLFERFVPGHDFSTDLLTLCPELGQPRSGPIHSASLPYLRQVICLDSNAGPPGIDTWPEVVARSKGVEDALIDAMAADVAPADVAMIFFSSGSTGRPKGIIHSHRAASLQCWRWAGFFAADRNVRTWTANGFFWSGNFAMAIGATFAAGGSLVLQRYFVAGEALRLMAEEKVTLPLAWPHQWARLVSDPSYLTTDLKALRYVGETSPLRQHPTVNATWNEPTSAYGNTETLTLVTVYPSGTDVELQQGNHGPPLPGNSIRIIDALTGELVPLGESGEITVKGPTLMMGYLKTVQEKVFDEDGYFRTGDGGFIDGGGRLHWLGRLNDIIKTGGANVSPLEIDAVLMEYPGVRIAKTVGVAHETLGEMVVACVVAAPDAHLQEGSIIKFISDRLSNYKVPRRVLFAMESDLAMTGTNKVKVAELRAWATRQLAGPGAA